MKNKAEYSYRTVLDFIVIASLLTACSPPTKAVQPTPEKQPIPKVSPVVLCHVPVEGHPNAFDMIVFENQGTSVEMTAQLFDGSEATKPDAQGWLSPVPDKNLVRTGLNGILIPVAKVGEKIIEVDLGGCLVDKKEQKGLQDFFHSITPDQIHPPGQTTLEGLDQRFTSTIVSPRGITNPFKGQIDMRQVSRRPIPQRMMRA